LDDDVGNLPVERVTNSHQIPEHLGRIGRAQKWPIAVTRRPVDLLLDRGMQVDDSPSRMQSLTILWTHHRPTARGQHQTILLRQLGNYCLLPLTKALLTLDIEDPRNIS